MNIDPSEIVYFQWGFVRITATLVFTWLTMFLLTVFSFIATRNIRNDYEISKSQNVLESFLVTINGQIRDVSREEPGKYLPFIGTLFIFILSCNVLAVVPGFIPPTGSLNTTIALAMAVFFAVPFYGISSQGLKSYLRQYVEPTIIMLPFNVIGEFSRTLALTFRLYGNIMSGTVIVAVLLGVIPLFFPVLIQALGLLTGVIQAYIFAILAIVYIASSTKKKKKKEE